MRMMQLRWICWREVFVFTIHFSSPGKWSSASRVACVPAWLWWQLPTVGTFRASAESTRIPNLVPRRLLLPSLWQ